MFTEHPWSSIASGSIRRTAPDGCRRRSGRGWPGRILIAAPIAAIAATVLVAAAERPACLAGEKRLVVQDVYLDDVFVVDENGRVIASGGGVFRNEQGIAMRCKRTSQDTSGYVYALTAEAVSSPEAASDAMARGFFGKSETDPAFDTSIKELSGGYMFARNRGTGSVEDARGLAVRALNSSAGTVQNAYGMYVYPLSNPYGTVVNNYGVFIADQNAGENNYSLYVEGPSFFAEPILEGSSRESKENILDIDAEQAAAVLAALRPVRFNYIRNPGEEFLGFVAEEVPDLVSTRERKGVVTMDFVAVLTRVVQEQQRTIAALEKKVAELERRMGDSE